MMELNPILNTLGFVTLMFISELSVEKKGSSLPGSGISGTQQSKVASFSGFKVDSLKNFRDLPDVRSMFAAYSKHVTDCLHRVTGRFNPSG